MDYSNLSVEEIRALREKRKREAAEKARLQREKQKQFRKKMAITVCVALAVGLGGKLAISAIKNKAEDSKKTEATTQKAMYIADAGIIDTIYSDVTHIEYSEDGTYATSTDANQYAEQDIEETISGSENSDTATETEITDDGSSTIKITIVGDCMIASPKGQISQGNFAWYADNKPATYFLDQVSEYFLNDDLTIANCENVFSDQKLAMRQKNSTPAYWYISKAKNANILSQSGVDVVSLSNNHILDYGTTGKEDTKKACEAANLAWAKDDKIYYYEKDGFTIAVVCIQAYAYYEVNNIVKYIQEASINSDFQIVYFHGGTMNVHEPDSWKVKACHDFVDYGADLVVGSHPHVLQKIENYNGVDIVYSLGNFCYGGNSKSENRTIIYQYNLTVNEGFLVDKSSNMIPCYLYTGNPVNWKPSVITDETQKKKVIDYMNGLTSSPK